MLESLYIVETNKKVELFPWTGEVQAEPDMIGNYIEMYHLAPAKYMDKKHWLAVPLDGSVSDSKVLDLLDMSYDLVDGQAETDGETGADR